MRQRSDKKKWIVCREEMNKNKLMPSFKSFEEMKTRNTRKEK